MKFNPLISVSTAVLVTAAVVSPVFADEAQDAAKTVQSANRVLQEFVNSNEIPPAILRQSQGIAIFPKVTQAGFFLGGRRGQGIMMVRTSNGSWSNPVFITTTGGSVGLQFGARSSDIVLAFQDAQSMRKVYDSSFRLGGNVSGTAGPIGKDAVFPTDSTGNIYSYTKSEGLFGGVALAGIKIEYDDDRTASFYEREDITARQVFNNQDIAAPRVVRELQRTLRQSVSSR
jgi:SH3 domain-containing YSC84-like protein 1